MASLRQSSPEDIVARHARRMGTTIPQFTPHKAVDYSKVSSRVGSLVTVGHKPGGGKKKIVNERTDYSHVPARTDNRFDERYTPGGGNVRITNEPWKPAGVAPRIDSRNDYLPSASRVTAQTKKSPQGPKSADGQAPMASRPKLSRRASEGDLNSEDVRATIERLSVTPTTTHSESQTGGRKTSASAKSSPSGSPNLTRDPLKLRPRRGSREERPAATKLPLGLRRYASSSAMVPQRKTSAPARMMRRSATSTCLLNGRVHKSSLSADSGLSMPSAPAGKTMRRSATMPTLTRSTEQVGAFPDNGSSVSDLSLATAPHLQNGFSPNEHPQSWDEPPSILKETGMDSITPSDRGNSDSHVCTGYGSSPSCTSHQQTPRKTPSPELIIDDHLVPVEQTSTMNGIHHSPLCTSTPKRCEQKENDDHREPLDTLDGTQATMQENHVSHSDGERLDNGHRGADPMQRHEAETERRKSSTSVNMLLTHGEHTGSFEKTEVSWSSSSNSNSSSSSPEQTLADELQNTESASDDDAPK